MAATGELLQLTPAAELAFKFELRRNIPTTLSLRNPTGARVAFKVKTTSPKKYCVRPSSGVVEPGATKDVQVIMQAQREYPPSLADCRDKFLVQCVKLPEGTRASAADGAPPADLFEPGKARDLRQHKLRVVLTGPPKPPSPVPEGVEGEEPSPGARGPFGGAPAAAGDAASIDALYRERDRMRDALARADRERAGLQARLDTAVRGRGGGGGGARAGFSVVTLVLVALLAFAVGHVLAKRLA